MNIDFNLINWLITLQYCHFFMFSDFVSEGAACDPLVFVDLWVDGKKLPSMRRATICFYKLLGMCPELQTSARLAYEISHPPHHFVQICWWSDELKWPNNTLVVIWWLQCVIIHVILMVVTLVELLSVLSFNTNHFICIFFFVICESHLY